MEYWRADEADEMVQNYMKYHADLIGSKIACIFKEKATKSDGVPVVGKISKVSKRYQCLMTEDYDFILEVGADAWVELNNSQKEAWIDHLLEHAYGVESETTGDMTWKIRKPEVMGFPSIIHRHGINWMPGLAKIAHLNIPQKSSSKSTTKRGSVNTSEEGPEDYSDLTSDM